MTHDHSQIIAWLDLQMRQGMTVTFKEWPNGLTPEVEVYAGGQLVGVGTSVAEAMREVLGMGDNARADLPPTEARGPRSGTEGAIGG